MLVLHVRRLDEGSLARWVYEEQVSNQWPGLGQEVQQIYEELGVESALTTKVSKASYRNKLIVACHEKNKEKIKSESEGKTKCERILTEKYGRKNYVNYEQIHRVRETYKARFGLLSFAENYTNDKRFSDNGGLCKCKRAIEEEPHLLSGNCEMYSDIRHKYGDLGDDKNLVRFFTQVLEMRDAIDEAEKNKR